MFDQINNLTRGFRNLHTVKRPPINITNDISASSFKKLTHFKHMSGLGYYGLSSKCFGYYIKIETKFFWIRKRLQQDR